MTEPRMTLTRPYLVRAIYDWVLDNQCTPYIVVDADYPNTEVPSQYIEDGKIILNLSPVAVQGLRLANDHIEFNARFNGVSMHIHVPILAVLAIYAKENGRGMVFHDDEEGIPPPEDEDNITDDTTDGDNNGGTTSGKKGRPTLTVVK